MFLVIWLLLAVSLTCANLQNDEFSSVPRGAQIRVTKAGMQYAVGVGVRKLHEKLTNRKIGPHYGHHDTARWGSENLMIHFVRINEFRVTPIPNVGLRLYVGRTELHISGDLWAKYKANWINLDDRTHLDVTTSDEISFTVDFKVGAKSGRPTFQATTCSASIGYMLLKFTGGIDWLYNILGVFLQDALKAKLRNFMCNEGKALINMEANLELLNFPVRKNLGSLAYIDYSFEKPYITSEYIDLYLRGEFLNFNHPVHSGTPPTFDTTKSSSKMVYVWLTDYTLNSLGKVFHDGKLLGKIIKPGEKIPIGVQMFMNTATLKDLIPQLFKKYPNRPIQIRLDTFRPPHFHIHPGGINQDIFVKAGINVVQTNNQLVEVFHLDISVSATGKVSLKKVGTELNIAGKINNYRFKIGVGGSLIGKISLPIENQSIKDMVRGLVVDQANPLLEKGFPVPKSSRLKFINPSITYVQNAVRVDTNISYD